jgi:hypothetical protein
MKSTEKGAKLKSRETSGNRQTNILMGAVQISLKRETWIKVPRTNFIM